MRLDRVEVGGVHRVLDLWQVGRILATQRGQVEAKERVRLDLDGVAPAQAVLGPAAQPADEVGRLSREVGLGRDVQGLPPVDHLEEDMEWLASRYQMVDDRLKWSQQVVCAILFSKVLKQTSRISFYSLTSST